MRLDAVGEAQDVAAERQARRLKRAMHVAERDAGGLEEGQLEESVVGDDVDAVQEAQHLVARAEEIDDRDPAPAAI